MHPALVGRLLYPLHERLKGKPTFPWLRRLETSQWLPLERLREYQLERLRRLLAFAYERVPYYRALFDEHGIAPARIGTLADFARIPPLTRRTLRERFADLQARPALPRTQRLATGGSTGEPVAVVVDMQRMGFGEAARLRAHRWFGLEPGVREMVLWGSPIELSRQDRLRALRDRLLNSRLLSAFDLGEPALARYAEAIRRFRPAKMYGYASAFYLLARYLEATRWDGVRDLKAIFTTAEPLYDFQRETIERVFGCAVAVEYGARDGGLVANECPTGGLHIPVEGMHVEVLGAAAGGAGEIVVTVLDSFAFPIVRYRTGDVGALAEGPCACGRTLPRLRSVDGRRTDFIVTADGRCLHALAVIYPLREIPGIREFRVVQDALDHITVSVAPGPAFGPEAEERIRRELAARVGARVEIEVRRADELERSPSGKFRYVISAVAEERIAGMLQHAGGAAR